MAREQFTFYRSFWEAIKGLKKKEDRLAALEAICAYALDGEERKTTDVAAGMFILIRPVLDAAEKKSSGGKIKGSKTEDSGKIKGSKTEDSGKIKGSKTEDSGKEKEGEKEKEGDIEVEEEKEKENECYISSSEERKESPSSLSADWERAKAFVRGRNDEGTSSL